MTKQIKTAGKKVDLLRAIQDLLQDNTVGTQEEIREVLEKQGLIVNQVKISRILNKLGAIKINEGNRTVYRLPAELISVTPNDALKNLVLNISHNESLIVIQTAPGSAQLVARLLDLKKANSILGCVAGDDTIFVAPKTVSEITVVFKNICQLLLG